VIFIHSSSLLHGASNSERVVNASLASIPPLPFLSAIIARTQRRLLIFTHHFRKQFPWCPPLRANEGVLVNAESPFMTVLHSVLQPHTEGIGFQRG
jgi:hypothetical protein